VREDVKFTTYRRDLRGRRDVTEENYYGCRRRDLYITTVNSCENEAPSLWSSNYPRKGFQALRRQELDTEVLKSLLLDGHVLHVMKLVLTRYGREDESPHSTDGAVAQKFRRHKVTVNLGGVFHYVRRGTRNFTDPHFPI